MMELLAALRMMLDEARARAGSSGPHGGALQQLVLILADGRFHEKEALRRAVQVRASWPGTYERGCMRHTNTKVSQLVLYPTGAFTRKGHCCRSGPCGLARLGI